VATSENQGVIRVVAPGEGDTAAHLLVSADASLQALYESPSVPGLLRRTLGGSLSWQFRAEHSITRVMQSSNLAPPFVAVLLALGARVVLEKAEGPLDDYLRRRLPAGQPLAAVRIPMEVPGRAWGETHVARTPADQPIVSAVAVVDLADGVVRQARLALSGAWRGYPRLLACAQLLVGGTLADATIRQVAEAAEREVEPPDDYRGSAEYRRAMAAVLARRSLEACMTVVPPLAKTGDYRCFRKGKGAGAR
jgi:CO/xanthine dehydrogenase FAD-binding subunit